MKKDELLATLSENINNVFSVDGFKKILNRANSLTGFDTMNRILIHQQYDNAYDVKVVDEWELKNRHIRKNAKPIYIFMPITDVKYMDVESGVIIPDNELDLNSVELHEAISRGLIEKTKDIVDVQVIPAGLDMPGVMPCKPRSICFRPTPPVLLLHSTIVWS